MQKDDFLSHFRRTRTDSSHLPTGVGHSEVYFQLDVRDGVPMVNLVDGRGMPIRRLPDFRGYQGEVYVVLRLMNALQEQQPFDIHWDSRASGVSLYDAPALLHPLLRCSHMVDNKMKPIRVSGQSAEIVLSIREDDGQCVPRVVARTEEQAGASFVLLSDVYALVDNTIYSIPSLGVNFDQLHFFEEPFPKSMIEQYLSVFFSYVDHCELDYEGYTMARSEQTVQMVPTLIIEKVDEDMALYLRLSHTLPGENPDFAADFDLTWVASLSMEQQVVLRRVMYDNEEDDLRYLVDTINRYAPSRKDAKEVWHRGGDFIVPQATAGPFLLNALPELVRHFLLLGTDRLRDYKVRAVSPKMKLSLSSGIDFLEGSADIDIDGETFSLRQFLQEYQKNRYITLSDGNRALVDEEYVRRLGRIFRKVEKGDKVKISFFDLPEIEYLLQGQLRGKAFEHHRKFYQGFNALPTKRIKYGDVKAKLRNYQKEGVKWINYLYENNMGACLADDMGLGKTLQTITMLTRIYPEEQMPSLIVMPRSLLFNWQEELHKFAPQLTYYTYYGPGRDLEEARKSQLILTTYALVRNDIEQLRNETFHYIILDESQNIKNLSSQSTHAVLLLQAQHRLALSGTPIENNLTELYSLFRFLNPTMLGTVDDFNEQYTYPIQRYGDKEATESLRRKIFPFILRRLKRDVLKELPDRMEQTLYVEMDDEHRRYYEQRRKFYQSLVGSSIAAHGLERSQMVMFQALSELRRIASVPESLTDGSIASPKLPLLAEQIEELVSGGHKVVVFFNFIAGIELLGERLSDMGIDYATMTGSTRDRKAVVDRFQNDSSCKALLMTLKTGGVGLNLTVADTVYIAEPWWNKAAEEQAINRLHRIGQKAKVMSYALITRDTIEEKIRLLQQQKQDLADNLITGDTAISKYLTEEDIKYILG